MKYETERILQTTPFNTYFDLFQAVFSGKASIQLSNSACRQICKIKKPFLSGWGMFLGLIPSAMLTVAFSVHSKSYFLLLLILLECFFPFFVYLLNCLKIKTQPIAIAIVLFDLFLGKLPLFFLISALCWLLCLWTISWWQKKIYVVSIQILQHDEEAFVWAYNSSNLFISDCYGNTYSKLQEKAPVLSEYERLMKILKIAYGVHNIDQAISECSSFYLKKGVDIPASLYQNISHLSEQQKHENLLRIFEIATGSAGINKVTAQLLAYCQSKGISFPSDVL